MIQVFHVIKKNWRNSSFHLIRRIISHYVIHFKSWTDSNLQIDMYYVPVQKILTPLNRLSRYVILKWIASNKNYCLDMRPTDLPSWLFWLAVSSTNAQLFATRVWISSKDHKRSFTLWITNECCFKWYFAYHRAHSDL